MEIKALHAVVLTREKTEDAQLQERDNSRGSSKRIGRKPHCECAHICNNDVFHNVYDGK